jgi:hypothetical protein
MTFEEFRTFAELHNLYIRRPYLFDLPKTQDDALKDINWIKKIRKELRNVHFEDGEQNWITNQSLHHERNIF